MVKGAPVGVFDSGIGGLTVLEEIQQLLPHESLLYVADCGHIPYGEKTPAFILERSRSVAEFFRERGAKAFVIACNTATVAAVADLRQDYPDWPLVGVVGSLQALEALKLLAGFGESLVGRLLLIDALTTRFRELRVKRDPGCSVCGAKHG